MIELDQRYDVVRGLEPEVIVGAAEHHTDKVIVIVIELVRLQEPVHRETQRAALLQRSGEQLGEQRSVFSISGAKYILSICRE